ncbi:MAG TPA: glycosyltransferase family 39 protein [Acidimicrobiales bacterium]|nr:glycosyltransferase family 39 protein [Acidimicrobiales bacterium]
MPNLAWLALPLAAFAASRFVGLVAAYMVRFVLPGTGLLFVMTRWDATWYLMIAERGYPRHLPAGDVGTPLGFFPLYPLLIRGVEEITGIGYKASAVTVNTAAAAAAAVLVWRLARDVFDAETADRAALLFCFFPGSYALTLAYTEGIFIACSAACLLLLHHRRFWWAALAGGIGSAARPTGYVLALACAFAVFMHWRETRDWKPLPTPVLAAGGLIAFLVFLHVHTGDAFAWQRAQERGWGQHLGWSGSIPDRVIDYIASPVNELNVFVPILTAVVLVPLLWNLVRVRPPGAWLVFVGASLVPSLFSTSVAFTPRHLFSLFPLVIAAAHTVRGVAFSALLALCAGTFAFFVFVMGGTTGVTP